MKKFFYKYKLELVYTTIFLISILFRIFFINIKSDDYLLFLNNWWNKINEYGGFNSLKYTIGDYPDSYMFLLCIGTSITKNSLIFIKVLSAIFDILIFLFGYKIIKYFSKEDANKYSWILILLPGILVNSAILSQCDSIYTAFVLAFIYYILKNHNKLALSFLGIAISFKLQSLFIAPVILYLIATKKIKIYDLFFIILGFLLPFIPTILIGKGLIENIKILMFQTSEYNYFVKSCPNIYSLFLLNYKQINIFLKYSLAIIVGIIAIFISLHKYKDEYNDTTFIYKSFLISTIVVFLLPSMHDRYFYLANILGIIYYIVTSRQYLKGYCILSTLVYVLPVLSINFMPQDLKIKSDYMITSLVCSTLNLFLILDLILNKHFLLSKKSWNNCKTLPIIIEQKWLCHSTTSYFL